MIGMLVIIIVFILISWGAISDIINYRRARLFSRATYNNKKHQMKIKKQVRTTVKKTIRKRVSEAVKEGRFEFGIILDWDTSRRISRDEVEDIVNEEYDGQVEIEKFELFGAGSRVVLKIVK